MRKRTRYSLLIALALLGALVVAILLRKNAPPEVARLLPESDGILYLNLKPIRLITKLDQKAITRTPDYQKFIDATGFLFERDLDAVAFSLHRMDDPTGPNGPVAYSEVFEGRFDGKRLSDYLRSISSSTENYAGHEIFTVPVENRKLRVTTLGYDMVAASNMPTAEQLHSILDRYRASASPFSGSSLLGEHYSSVPLLSFAWGIGQIGLPLTESGNMNIGGVQLPLPQDATFVASARFVGSLRLRVEEIAANEQAAARDAGNMNMLLTLFRGFELNQARSAEDTLLLEALANTKIEQKKERTVLTSAISLDALRRASNNQK
ncbi:hypothetical protein FTW19_20510 [Terriglobus albidus]|uniref:DUF3352 domain-containing protein n=1 Tax=Terriglobus albidus TaxID=1592106 RepID=A0A5B9ED97_9BACT|nr:hypothetical protein [Terriglobus albidus]QEE30153.1 hypothetical protein FTW19_20510 [Terriglobus albidus]